MDTKYLNLMSCFLNLLSSYFIGYFLRMPLIRYNFCAVKLLGCIWGKIVANSCQIAGSPARNFSGSIFLPIK